MLSNWPGLVSRRAPACFEKDTVSPYADARLQRLTPCCFGCERTGTFQVSHRVTARLRKGMAEREGFEPPIPFQVCRLSRPVPSTTRPPLRLLQFYYSRDEFVLGSPARASRSHER